MFIDFRYALRASLAIALLVATAGTASAAPILTGTATVTESFTGASDSVTVDNTPGAAELKDGDGSNIANDFFFSGGGESIDLQDLDIVLTLYGGGDPVPGFPGYRTPGVPDLNATFTFAGLSFLPSASIVGVSVSAPLLVNVGPGNVSFTSNSVVFNYASIGIPETQANLGTVTLSLRVEETTQPPAVPEPATLTLLGLGLAGGALRSWRARRPA